MNDSRVTISNAQAAAHLGIRAVHQGVRLLPDMTVGENILLEFSPHKHFAI